MDDFVLQGDPGIEGPIGRPGPKVRGWLQLQLRYRSWIFMILNPETVFSPVI